MGWNIPLGFSEIKRPLVPLSADPWTAGGHAELVREAVDRFGSAVVAVMTDEQRPYVLPADLRAALARDGLAAAKIAQCRVVVPRSNTIGDAVLEHGCDGVVRGARCRADLEVEERRRRCSGDTVPGLAERWAIWEPEGDARHVSATRIRDAILNGAFLSPDLVSYRAQRALRYYLRGERTAAVVALEGLEPGRARRLGLDIAEGFSEGPNPVAVHVISVDSLLAGMPAAPWMSKEEGILFRAAKVVGKARPSIRLFCAGAGIHPQVVNMLGIGILVGDKEDGVADWGGLDGMRVIPVWRDAPGGPLRGASSLLSTFEEG